MEKRLKISKRRFEFGESYINRSFLKLERLRGQFDKINQFLHEHISKTAQGKPENCRTNHLLN